MNKQYNQDTNKFVEPKNFKAVKFTEPEWLSKYDFFTSNSIEKGQEETFCLSESSTGAKVPGTYKDELQAKIAGQLKLIQYGQALF